MQKFWRWLKR